MGNCLVLDQEKKVIKALKSDGQTLNQQPPLEAAQACSKSPGQAISDALPVVRQLDSTDPPSPPTEPGIIRIKLVLTKEELRQILSKGGVSRLEGMISQFQREASREGERDKKKKKKKLNLGWRPALDSISEVADYC